MIDTRMRHIIQPLFNQAGKWLHKIGFKPCQITLTAFLAGLAAAFFISRQWTLPALLLLWLSGSLDVLDGTIARISDSTSPAGALMDLILDRMVEAAVILGFYFLSPEQALAHLLFLVGIIFNFSTFLAAGTLFPNEGSKSMHYDPGVLERTETFLLFTVMILWPAGRYWLLMTFTAAMFLTGILRTRRLFQQDKKTTTPREE